MSKIDSKVSYLSEFNFDSVLRELNISKKKQPVIRALRFVYDCILDEQRDRFKTRREMVTAAAKRTIKKTEPIYNLIDTYAESYFWRSKFPRDSLITIALIGDFIGKANIKGHRKNFSTNLMADIKQLHDDAESICNGKTGNFDTRAIFLAHIRSMQFIQIVKNSIEEFSLEDLDAILTDNIPVIEDLCDSSTDIGFELNEESMSLREIIDERINQLCQEYEAEDKLAEEEFGAVLISMLQPPKTAAQQIYEPNLSYITDFNEVAIYDQLSIKDNEMAAKASIRFLFAALAREIDIKTLYDRQDTIKAIVRATRISYDLASGMSGEFMDGSDGEKDALVIAAICEHQSYLLGKNKIVDVSIIDFAQSISVEATSALSGHPENITCPQAEGLSYIFATKQIIDNISDLQELESEEDFLRLSPDLKNIRSFMSTESGLGKKLQERIDELHNNLLSFHFSSQSPLDQAMAFLKRDKRKHDLPVKPALFQNLYANDVR